MKDFIQMLMMKNLAIHITVFARQTAVPCLTKFLKKSHQVTYKRKRIGNINKKEENKNTVKGRK